MSPLFVEPFVYPRTFDRSRKAKRVSGSQSHGINSADLDQSVRSAAGRHPED